MQAFVDCHQFLFIFPFFAFCVHFLISRMQHSDMIDEMRAECVELSITACEKFAANYEVSVNTTKIKYRNPSKYKKIEQYNLFSIDLSMKQMAAKSIKEAMDKKFGTYWHVIVGEGFGFEVSYETKNILYLYFGGNLAIVMWKCS